MLRANELHRAPHHKAPSVCSWHIVFWAHKARRPFHKHLYRPAAQVKGHSCEVEARVEFIGDIFHLLLVQHHPPFHETSSPGEPQPHFRDC